MDTGEMPISADVNDEIVALIRANLMALLPHDASHFGQLSAASEIRSLRIDSLMLLEVVTALEDRIRRPLDERALSKATTLGDIATLVREELRAAGSPAASIRP
jgi:acyl carrier protein